jgi:hypothetical protein
LSPRPPRPALPAPAAAQTSARRPAARQAPAYPDRLQIRPFVSAGTTWFTASKTFKAVLGSGQGQDFGGGLNLTQGPAWIEVSARRFSKSGERVFVTTGGQVFPLGIDTDITMTPLEWLLGSGACSVSAARRRYTRLATRNPPRSPRLATM